MQMHTHQYTHTQTQMTVLTRNSSGDEITDVNFFMTTSYMQRPASTPIEPKMIENTGMHQTTTSTIDKLCFNHANHR